MVITELKELQGGEGLYPQWRRHWGSQEVAFKPVLYSHGRAIHREDLSLVLSNSGAGGPCCRPAQASDWMPCPLLPPPQSNIWVLPFPYIWAALSQYSSLSALLCGSLAVCGTLYDNLWLSQPSFPSNENLNYCRSTKALKIWLPAFWSTNL